MAGYKCRGQTAKKEATRTLSKPPLKKYLARARARRAAFIEKSESEIIDEYQKMGFSNLADYFNDDGSLKKFSSLTEKQKAALKSVIIEEQEYTNKKGKKGV